MHQRIETFGSRARAADNDLTRLRAARPSCLPTHSTTRPAAAMVTPTAAQVSLARRLPKIELHAHLNGSIRRWTLEELALAAGLNVRESQIIRGDARTVSEMFAVFDVIHHAVRGGKTIRRIAREVLEDAEADGVVYLELRTTPRAHTECGLDQVGYVESVLQGFKDYEEKAQRDRRCFARLILSIDRRDPAEVTEATVDLALRYRDRGVVGIDLSGDPTKGRWETWARPLTRARENGLKITLHAGEVPDVDEETRRMIAFKPVSRSRIADC